MQRTHLSNLPVVWTPEQGLSGVASMKQFANIISEKYNVKIKDYWDLYKWSIENISEFWGEVWNIGGVVCSRKYDQVIDTSMKMSDRPEWFPGARLNFAENLLKFRDDHMAFILLGEEREVEYVTYAQLYEEACIYSAALRKFGLKKGDRAACFMPNRKEAVIAMLGVTSIGGIWTGALSLMGAQAVVNRLKQVEPRILFTIDRFQHNREEKEMLSKVLEIAKGLPSLKKIVIVPSREESKKKDISSIPNSCFLDDFLTTGRNTDGSVPYMEFEQVSFSHPVFICYTSGTTGLPKAIVHGASVLLSVIRDLWLHANGSRETVHLSMSPVGWGTWNWMVASTFIGSTIVLFEGVPYFLSPNYLWDMIDKFGITDLILIPSIIDELEKRNCLPSEQHHLTSLQAIVCGGSAAKEHNYEFVYNKINHGVVFYTLYGTTETLGANAQFDYTLQAHKGEISAPSLGVDIKIYDESGKLQVGELGEVVIVRPMPSLPIGLWGDVDGSLFKNTYFSKYPDAFSMGDIGLINPFTKGIIFYGRSDETLKPGGCRFGSSEIYNIVETFPEVLNSICVSHYGKDMSERAILFLKLQEGLKLKDDLLERIRKAIADELSNRHVPAVIIQTEDIPRNETGKKLEAIVKRIINNRPYNIGSVINPECLVNFKDLPELQGF